MPSVLFTTLKSDSDTFLELKPFREGVSRLQFTFSNRLQWNEFRNHLTQAKGLVNKDAHLWIYKVYRQMVYDDLMNKEPMGQWWPWCIIVNATEIPLAD